MYSLDPVTCSFSHTSGGTVQVEVQLINFATSTNVYPGVGNQLIGNLSANANGIISFKVGEGDGAWTAITPASITKNHMLVIYSDGSVIAFYRLDELKLEQSTWAEAIEVSQITFETSGNVTSNSGGNYSSDDFLFGSPQLDDDTNTDHDARMFFDKSKGAFRAGGVQDTQWDDANIGGYSFAAGRDNTASGSRSAITGGYGNTASGDYSTISGGYENIVSERLSAISGGAYNNVSDEFCIVSGGRSNNASNEYCTVSGGYRNTASGYNSTVSGGEDNTASESRTTISGGWGNTASGVYSTVSGGYRNTASGKSSKVSGGEDNFATGDYSIVSGGIANTASGNYSIVSGGGANAANGAYSTISGGAFNTANGEYNLVFGYDVDPSVTENLRVYFFSGDDPGMLALNRENADHPIHVGTNGTNGNGAHLTVGGTWTSTSSITKKDRFEDLDDDILNLILELPVKKWSYKNTNERHIGPFAEDFFRLFGTGDLNNNDANQYLSTMDVAGVSLRGVQVLIDENIKLRQANAEMQKRQVEFEQKLFELQDLLKKLSEKIEE